MVDLSAEGGCEGCSALEALVLHGAAKGCRITLCGSVNKECACTPLRWTALVTKSDQVCASGTGHTQDEAILQALRTLGLVP